MKITDVRVRKVAKEGKMKAVVSITFDDIFVVHDIKVIDGDKGLLLQCQAESQAMVSTATLHIQSIQKQEIGFKRQF